ncbi:MAG: 50S ribosomal protein L25 [Ignavibacteria bacterium]|nr:50S ribosomal protein L25 [Ignavibacteria bacterium]
METKVVNASVRTLFGKSGRNQLKSQAKVPGIFYANKTEPVAIEALENSIKQIYFTSKSYLINLEIEGKETQQCVLKDVQVDPVTDRIIHFDMYGLTKGEKVTIDVPVKYEGNSIGVIQGGQLQINLHKLTIQCLPKDLPNAFTVDISPLKLGHSFNVGKLNVENITILHPAETVLCTITIPRGVEIPVETEEEMKEPEVISRGKDKDDE